VRGIGWLAGYRSVSEEEMARGYPPQNPIQVIGKQSLNYPVRTFSSTPNRSQGAHILTRIFYSACLIACTIESPTAFQSLVYRPASCSIKCACSLYKHHRWSTYTRCARLIGLAFVPYVHYRFTLEPSLKSVDHEAATLACDSCYVIQQSFHL
jgi:hypothetical protein